MLILWGMAHALGECDDREQDRRALPTPASCPRNNRSVGLRSDLHAWIRRRLRPTPHDRRCALDAAINRASELDQAYVQSRVIETGLRHLWATLSQIDDMELRGELSDYALRFDAYVRRLAEARERVAAEELPS